MKAKFSIVCLIIASALINGLQAKKISRETMLMGCRFELAAIHVDSVLAAAAVQKGIDEIQRIEELISSHKEASFTSAINQYAGLKSVPVPEELYKLIGRCKRISDLSDGAFDISYAVMDRLWDFKDPVSSIPSADSVTFYKSLIDYRNIELQADTSVFLKKKGMRIGFGAIGKGYAANRAKLMMTNMGVKNGYVDASGDVLFWGANDAGKPWQVGIADPKGKSKMLGWLNVNNMAVVTSGNYESFILDKNQQYSHILDPKTGWPSKGLSSVTVVCANAELADALATSLTVLGPKEGLVLINSLNGVECLIVTDDGEIYTSQNLNLNKLNF